MLGFFLEPFQTSVRKRLRKAPKFYFFDGGISRALAGQLDFLPKEGTSYFGIQFEAFIINEIFKANEYSRLRWKMNYLQTEARVEIDLVLSKAGFEPIFIEIKSTTELREDHLKNLKHLQKEFPNSHFYCISRDPHPQKFDAIEALPWQMFLQSPTYFNPRPSADPHP